MPAQPNAQTDFNLTLDRAANAILDASCACRSAGHGHLPHPHRRLLSSAIASLDRAQTDLFRARNDPWSNPCQPQKPNQMSLPL
jgi:hypothetical protein